MTDEQLWAAWTDRSPESPDDDGAGDSERGRAWAPWQIALLAVSASIGTTGTVAVGFFAFIFGLLRAAGCSMSGHCTTGLDLMSAAISLLVLVGCFLLALVIGTVPRLRLVFVLACATMVVVPIVFLAQLL